MNSIKNIDSIKSNELFKNIDFLSIDFPFDAKNFEELKEGDIIYSAGQPANFLYLLIEGEVKVKLTSVKRLFFKSSNEFFGESEILGNTERNSSALANNDCTLYKIEKSLLNRLLNDSSELRLNLLNEQKSDTDKKEESTKIEDPTSTKSKLDLESDTIKIDINQVANSLPKYGTTIDIDKMQIHKYEQEPDLDDFIQQKYLESDNKSLKSKLIDNPDDMSNWIITEAPLDIIPPKNESQIKNTEVSSSSKEFSNVSTTASSSKINDDEFKELKPSSDIKQVVKNILEFLLHKTDSKVGAIYLFSSENQMLKEIHQTNESIYKGNKSIKEGITGLAARDKKIRFAVSFLNDINYNQEIDRPNDFVGDSIIFIPFVDDKNNLLGIAQIGSNETMFTKSEENNIKEYANYCSKILQESLSFKPNVVLSSKSELNQISNFIIQDVKAPLLTVKHYSAILSRFDLPEEVKKVISLLSGQTNSIIDILQASIDFSEKNTKNRLEIVNFDEELNHVLTFLSDYVESRNVKLFKKLDCDEKVKIDKRKFNVACYYISRFSCDVMKQGGNLYFSSKVEGTNAVLKIKDENKFIKQHHIDKVFDPAFNNDNDEKIGLSLAISKFIVESMKGAITAQIDDSGTSYLVSIPISS